MNTISNHLIANDIIAKFHDDIDKLAKKISSHILHDKKYSEVREKFTTLVSDEKLDIILDELESDDTYKQLLSKEKEITDDYDVILKVELFIYDKIHDILMNSLKSGDIHVWFKKIT